jgi:hypothetical protein
MQNLRRLTFSAARLALGLLAVCCVPSLAAEEKSAEPAAVAKPNRAYGPERPKPEVIEGLRLLLSKDPTNEARGELILRRLGASIHPQLRYWVRKVRSEASRVELFAASLAGQSEGTPVENLTADEFLYQKTLEARKLAAAGKHAEAQRLAEAVVALDVGNPHAWLLRRLARQARHRIAAKEVLEPSVVAAQLAYAVGEKPEVVFRLRNHQRRAITIELDKGVLGEVDMTVTRRLLDGSMARLQRKLRVQIETDEPRIVIGPGQTWEYPVPVPFEKGLPLEGFLVRVQIAGRFRPTRWGGAGKEAFENLSLQVPLTEFWMAPPGLHNGCEQPLEKLTAALLFGKREPLFAAGWIAVWAAQEDPFLNEKVVATLIAHVAELDPPRRVLAGQLLDAATGESFGDNSELWQRWWASHHPEATTASKERRPESPRG